MPRDHKDNFYDLRHAREIAVRLGGGSEGRMPSAGVGDAYVSFSTSTLSFSAAAATAASPSEPPEPHAELHASVPWGAEMEGSSGWTKLLEWMRGELSSDAAFIVDRRGLVIASAGELSTMGLEETGARLVIAFEQGEQMLVSMGVPLSVTIELQEGWIVGIRIPAGDDEFLVAGIVGPQPLSRRARAGLLEAFTKKALGA